MTGQKINIWRDGEYDYAAAYGFVPFIVSYIHEDDELHPGMLVVPGGAYRYVSPSEGHRVAEEFYRAGYNAFVLAYTVNYLDEPLGMQPLNDISRAVRMIRDHADRWGIDAGRLAVCGFSAGGHLCASLCVHYEDIVDPDERYEAYSNRPDAAVLCYPVITTNEYANRESFIALLGKEPDEKEVEYMSLEKHVKENTPPCFLWQTVTDTTVPVENSYLYANACHAAGVPYAHHVFSDGIHGLSVATDQWLERDFGDRCTEEQIRFLADAIRQGKTSYPTELGEQIASDFGFGTAAKEKWDPVTKEKIRKTLAEVSIWPKLAETWLESQWERIRWEKKKADSVERGGK